MKILFIDNNDQLRQLYTVYLDNILNDAQIVELISAQRAIEMLDDQPDFDMILSDYQLKDGTAGDVYTYMKNNNLTNIPFVLFSSVIPDMYDEFESYTLDNPKNSNIIKPISPAAFRDAILKILQPSVVATHAVKAFQKVRLIYFYRFNKVLCDVYMKLSDRKYVKIINKNDTYTRKDLEKIQDKDLTFLFIRNDDFEKFSVGFTKTPFLITDTTKMSEEELEDALLTTHVMMQELVQSIGISEEVTNLAEKSVNEVIKIASKSNNLRKLVRQAREAKDYVYDHSYLVSVICCAIAQNMDWDHEAAVQKLCMAALFHDINLKNPELAMARTMDDPKLAKFSKKEIQQFKDHPQEVAQMIAKSGIFPEEVEEIILHHHENTEQNGFPQKLHPSQLSNLDAIFIVAHDFVSYLYENDFDSEAQFRVLETMRRKYNFGQFQPALKALQGYIDSEGD